MKGLVLTLMFALISYSIHSRNCSITVGYDTIRIDGDTLLYYNSIRYDLTEFDKIHWIPIFKSNGTYLYHQADYYLISDNLLKTKLRIRKKDDTYIYIKIMTEHD
jgi:hypothetical protein